MQDIQEHVQKIFLDNIAYIENKHPELFKKLSSLDAAIEQGLYKEKYELVYEKDYFDVKEIETKNYLYNANSDKYAQTVSKSLNFDTNTNLFKTYKNITILDEDLIKYEKINITENSLVGLASILHYIASNSKETEKMKSLAKFIFFGVGLGVHLTTIDFKLNAKVYLIIEDDLELFRLSLFVTQYSKIAKNSKLIFSVFESSNEFSQTAKKFLNTDFSSNHYIKYFHMLNHSEKKLQDFHVTITSQSHNLFFYNSILDQYLKPLEYIKDNFSFLNILKKHFTLLLENKPLLFLASGPSLHKNINWVIANQKKFFIVALSSTLVELEKNSISPDMVTHLDGFEISAQHFKNLNSFNLFKDSIFLVSARTPKSVMKFLDKNKTFLFENGTHYKDNLGNLSAPCVGSTTYLLLIAFGIKNLYLLGLDLAIDSKTGFTHSQEHFQTKKIDVKNVNTHEDDMSFRDSLIKYPANLGGEAYTNPNFLLSVESISSTSKHFKKENQQVFNLSNGVFFDATIPTDINDINFKNMFELNKSVIRTSVLKQFIKYSSTKLKKEELININLRYSYALKIKKIIKKQESMQFTSVKQFLKSLELLYNTMASDTALQAYDLSLVYQEYFHILNTHIFNFFNISHLEEELLHIKNINKLLCKELDKIRRVYEESLKKFI